MGSLELDPSFGNIAFGSGIECWGFTLLTFAKMYSVKFKIDTNVLIKKLWGEFYFDAEIKKFSKLDKSASGKPLKRSFA